MLETALQYAARGWHVFFLSASKKPIKNSHGLLDATTDPIRLAEMSRWRGAANLAVATGSSGLVVLDADGPGGLAQLPQGQLPPTLVSRTPRGGLHLWYSAGGATVYSSNQKRATSGADGLDIKAAGGYVLAPPSKTRHGPYTWVHELPVAPLNEALRTLIEQRGALRRAAPDLGLGPVPDFLTGTKRTVFREALKVPHTAHDEARVRSALNAVPSDGYDEWLKVGMILRGLGWDRPDGTDIGFEIWDEWSQTCSAKYAPAILEQKWLSFGKREWNTASLGSLFHLAQEHGWRGEVGAFSGANGALSAAPGATHAGTNGAHGGGQAPGGTTASAASVFQSGEFQMGLAPASSAGTPSGIPQLPGGAAFGAAPQPQTGAAGLSLQVQPSTTPYTNGSASGPAVAPVAFPMGQAGSGQSAGSGVGAAVGTSGQPIIFPDTDRVGRPTGTCANARAAIRGLGLNCSYDSFHDRMIVNGRVLGDWTGEFSDNTTHMLRVIVRQLYGFEAGKDNTHDALAQCCLQNSFDPVCDYLEGLKWDGTPRIARWLHAYMQAADTPLNGEIGKLALVAAVRRVRHPGTKFDQIIVLEGPEGTGKSSAIEILAGSDNFSDQTILNADDRQQQEMVRGVWLYEIADLAGMKRAEVEHIKAFASRTTDRARPAYGRCRVDVARRCVFFATTNADTYLMSQTGNRRFWPVATGHIDLDGLRRDRDQLWAEAVALESHGCSLVLGEGLREEARWVQETRREKDAWDDLLLPVTGSVLEGESVEKISTRDLLEIHLQIPGNQCNDTAAKRLRNTMRRLGWFGPKLLRHDKLVFRGYWRELATRTKVLQGEEVLRPTY